MTTYAVGDIHGCYDAFRRLLAHIKFNPKTDNLRLVGDLVNRGADNLAVLRFVRAHEDCMSVVLGNHDLHLLAAHCGVVTPKDKDTINDILDAADGGELCAWLRRQPLAQFADGWLMVHAGVLPMWSASQVLQLAEEVGAVISGDAWQAFAAVMYGNEPAGWDETLTGTARYRVIINALTRLRICSPTGEMFLKFTGDPATAPAGLMPWFDIPNRKTAGTPIIFGHWSALGVYRREDLLAIDSGCLWGRQLTAARLPDGKIFQVDAKASQ